MYSRRVTRQTCAALLILWFYGADDKKISSYKYFKLIKIHLFSDHLLDYFQFQLKVSLMSWNNRILFTLQL